MKTVSNTKKPSRGGAVVYTLMRTAANGERYGVSQAFTARDLEDRDYAAKLLRRARVELQRFIAAHKVSLCV